MSEIEELKIILRERDCPFFEDEELEYYLNKCGNVNDAAYNCLLLKAENTSLSVSGMNCGDTSKYFKMIAQKYRKSNSGVLKGD